jgi:hypothetical protein
MTDSAPSDFRLAIRRAAARPESPWLAGLALAAGAALAWAVVLALPSDGGDVARARELGIMSATTLAGHSKSAETLRYLAGVATALGASLALYLAWAVRAGRTAGESPESSVSIAKPVGLVELLLVSVILIAVFSRWAGAPGASVSPWSVLAEEGEMVAWANTVLRGGALSRDTFCLYGPLSIWPVAILFAAFGPSLGLWRRWIFGVSAVASVPVYLLLRGMMRSRAGAFAAAAFITLVSLDPVPAMSWTLSRVGFGLGALACLCRASGPKAARWLVATGAALGLTTLYSQEVGIACGAGVGVGLLWRSDRVRAIGWVTLGGVAALAPFVAYIAARGALAATFDNLFLFARIRVLGFGALPFPALAWSAESLRGYVTPALLVATGFETARKLAAGERDMRTLTELALFAFGFLLFSSALSRADDTHFQFALPPALVLLSLRLEDGCFALAARGAPVTRRAAAALVVLLGALSLAPWAEAIAGHVPLLWARAPAGFRALELERAAGARMPDPFARNLEAIVTLIQQRTAQDEPIFVYPTEALLYFLADRPQATIYPLAVFAVTREQRLDLVAQLERTRPRYTVLFHYAPVVDGIPIQVALPEVDAYLTSNYLLDTEVGWFALLRRKG